MLAKLKKIANSLVGRIGLDTDERRTTWVQEKLMSLPAGGRILDAGAGSKIFQKYCSHLKYVSQDFGEYDGEQTGDGLAEKDVSTIARASDWDIVSDIIKIPEPDGSFDAILCTEVFEHLPDPISAIKEFSRLLKSGGKLIITAPFVSGAHMTPFHFYSGFNKYFYENNLGKFGFDIKELTPNGNFFMLLAQEIRRLPFMAKEYSGHRLRPWDYLPIIWMLFLLRKINRKDKKSAGFMSFGYCVVAEKKSTN